MSTIKSDSEDLTLNAHGSGNDIIFQSNASQVGSLTAEGVMTATSFAGSGAALTGLSSFDPDGAVTINDTGAAVDFRVESDNDANCLIVDGSADSVGIGVAAPTGNAKLHIYNGASGQASSSNNTEVVIENSSNTGIHFLTPNSSVSGLWFGDPEDNDVGRMYYAHSDNSLQIFTDGDAQIRIDSDGIKFGTDTAAANALDDYEEGYHTLALTDNAGDVTSIALNSSYNQLAYTKIGRVVHISGTIVVSSFSGGWDNGTLRLTLPFTVADLTDNSGQSTFTVGAHNVDFSSGGSVYAQTSEGTATATVYVSTDNTSAGKFQPQSSGQLYIGGSFIAA